MLTLKSKLTEFIALCKKHEACDDQGALTFMNKCLALDKEMTIAGLLKHYVEDKDGDARWSEWILSQAPAELDPEVRKIFISKITDTVSAFQTYIGEAAKVFTSEEDILLKAKFEGKLPTAEKQLLTGVVCRTTAEVAP
jgi:hypothetical protein